MKKLTTMFILFLLLSCSGEECIVSDLAPDQIDTEAIIQGEANWVAYRIIPGYFSATPTIYETNTVPFGRWEIIFKQGTNQCNLEPFSECHDLMKACGDAFGVLSPSNQNNVMLSYRFLPEDENDRYTGDLIVMPFLNIDGTQNNRWFTLGEFDNKPDWPMIEVDTGKVVVFQYARSFPDSLDLQIEYEGAEYKYRVWHPNITDNTRTIGVYAGGTSQPVDNSMILRRRICH